MPTCSVCNKKWTWFQTIKTIFKLTCPYCDKRQYESASSRKRGSMFALIPLVILPINALLEVTVGTAIILAIILGLLTIGSYPFILKLSNEQEPLF
jgi:CXXC-20-CXXC protein